LFSAQYEQLLNKTYAERRTYLRDFYISEILAPDRDLAKLQKKVDAIRQIALEHDDEDLVLEAGLMQLHINKNKSKDRKNIARVVAQVDSLHQIAEDKNIVWLMARLESFGHHLCFADQYNYELAFNYFEQLNQTLDKINQAEFPEKQVCYLQMGWAYYFFHDYDNALKRWKRGLLETPSNKLDQFIIELNNNIGVCFQKLNSIDSSEKYFKAGLKSLKFDREADSVWYGIIKGNIAENLFAKGRYNDALPLFQLAVRIGMKYKELGFTANGYAYLAAIYIEKGDLALAEQYLVKARANIFYENDIPRLEKLYPLFSKLFRTKGNHELSAIYLDSAIAISDSLKAQLSALQILRGHEKAELLQQRILQDERRIKTMQRNFLIAFVFILTFIAIYIFIQQRKKFRQQQQIQELELKQKENDLILANSQLDDFALAISEKQQLVDELMDKLGTSANTDAIIQLQQSTILTDEEWEHFKKLFEQVHSGYLVRLKEKLPDLSPAETRFMVLAKLKFSNKEMASTLGITQQAVRTTWYRLRKKLQLPEEGSPDELVSKI